MRMIRFLTLGALLAAGALGLSAPVAAIEYSQVQANKSQLTFVFKQMGVAVEGRFRRFPTQLRFDPSKPTAASAQMDIDMASVDAGSPDANEEVVSKAWFNVKSHPTARFVATTIKPVGGDRYDIVGKLTIKGTTRDVVAPATFRQEGSSGVIDGTLTIKRADFAIGEGPWADFGTVANEIQIKFRVVAATTLAKK